MVGARGPAFLTGPNFRTLLRYNNATSYALAVGLLAQQLAGGPGVQAPWPRDQQALSRMQIQALQSDLNRRGFASGTPDGLIGPTTRAAVRAYQRSLGIQFRFGQFHIQVGWKVLQVRGGGCNSRLRPQFL